MVRNLAHQLENRIQTKFIHVYLLREKDKENAPEELVRWPDTASAHMAHWSFCTFLHIQIFSLYNLRHVLICTSTLPTPCQICIFITATIVHDHWPSRSRSEEFRATVFLCVGLLTKAQIIQLNAGRMKECTIQEITCITDKSIRCRKTLTNSYLVFLV